MTRLAICTVVAASVVPIALAQPRTARSTVEVLSRVGERVETYYGRAQSLVSLEKVQIQTLDRGFGETGRPRRLEFELSVEWVSPTDTASAPDATIKRRLLKVNGRAARPNDEPGCMDPKAVATEPLAVFLRGRQHEHVFSWTGDARIDGRASVMLDFAPRAGPAPKVSWLKKGECVSVDVGARSRGRVWADAETGEVLRLDEWMAGMYEFPVPFEHQRAWNTSSLALERSDSSIRYRQVRFSDPDEVLLLPVSVETLTAWRPGGAYVRTTQTFSNYQRFITGGRIVEP
jgi:hypothetical protein